MKNYRRVTQNIIFYIPSEHKLQHKNFFFFYLTKFTLFWQNSMSLNFFNTIYISFFIVFNNINKFFTFFFFFLNKIILVKYRVKIMH